ncbi:hypothetical protein AKJ48_01250 [candidate division MSBL1 archaeon SCGC-AAA261O19]|uniref:SSD domain-containing protein n=1 Tax=candidate division MSBL1 archaeon SCGC-AAA261O19 TaxID=1698277 RepID=A0A133VEI5_9EURY|nr:hypothetical protein AKJ48_01250 [candidate division MSBL1 archaeon SCGC-AAA261O19]
MLKGFAEASEKRPRLTIALVGLVTIFMIYGATQVSMTSEMEEFLPQDYTSVKVTNEIENEVGATVNEMILIEGDNLTTANAFQSIIELQVGLENNPKLQNYIARVQAYPDYLLNKIENYENLTNAELEARIQQLLAQSEISSQTSFLLSDNRDATLVTILVNSQLPTDQLHDQTKDLHDYTQSFDENHENLRMSNTGMLSMELETRGMMSRDNSILIPAAIIVIILILYLAFRRLSDTGLPFLVLGLGAVWMIGVMGLAGIPFTMVYVALVPIILGVGIDYTIHMLNRYYEERGRKLSAGKSAVKSVKTVGIAISLTAITTMIGFGSFGVSDMPPIREFGFLAAAGVFFIFVLATTLLPSLLTIRDRNRRKKKKRKEKRGKDRVGKTLSKIELGTHHHKAPILIGAGVITALCVISATGLTTTMSFDTFLPQDVESVATMQEVEDYFGGQNTAYVLVEGEVTSSEGLTLIHSLENSVKTDSRSEGLITDSSSLTGLILYSTGGTMPENTSQLELVLDNLENNYPERMKRLLIEDNKAVVYFSIQAETDKEMEKASEIIRSHMENYSLLGSGLDFEMEGEPAVGGSPVIISDIMGSIMPSMRNSILLAILLVGILLAIVFRSIIMGLIGALPVMLALSWEFGALGGLGWSLDVMNMMVSALAIGIGVDFTIHVTHRFQEEWKKNGKSPRKAISTTIQSVGRAILAAAATTIGVFIVLSLSRMPPVARFGQLAAMVIFFALVGALVVLPSALLAHAKWKER